MPLLTEDALRAWTRAAFVARRLPFDGEPSLGLTFTGDVVVLGVEGGEAHDPHEECAVVAPVSALEEGLRRAHWDAATRNEVLVLRERRTTRIARSTYIPLGDAGVECTELYVSEGDAALLHAEGLLDSEGEADWDRVGALAPDAPARSVRVRVWSTVEVERVVTLEDAAADFA